jgi:hypothetical protein
MLHCAWNLLQLERLQPLVYGKDRARSKARPGGSATDSRYPVPVLLRTQTAPVLLLGNHAEAGWQE